MSEQGSSVVLPPRTYVRLSGGRVGTDRWAGEPDDQALRRRGPRRTRRRDAGGVRVARAPVRGRRRDRQVADRGAVVVRRTRPRVLAGRGGRGGRPGAWIPSATRTPGPWNALGVGRGREPPAG